MVLAANKVADEPQFNDPSTQTYLQQDFYHWGTQTNLYESSYVIIVKLPTCLCLH